MSEMQTMSERLTPDRKAIMWMSNAPWVPTGYGNQTKLFTRLIKKAGYDLGIFAFYGLEGGILTWEDGIPVFPKGGQAAFGLDLMGAHGAAFRADFLISLVDAWVLDVQSMMGNTLWVPWFPIDSEPLPTAVRNKVAGAHKRIAMSKFGKRMIEEAGLDCYYVPHGIDTDLFQPRDMADARQKLGLSDSKFVALMVAANKGVPSRKSLTQALQAFRDFHLKKKDSLLILHTSIGNRPGENAVNLVDLCQFLGLKYGVFGHTDPNLVDVMIADPYQYLIGYPDAYMANLYAASDVLLSPSMGEGFGIPIVEAQAAGCPVITGLWTAMEELTFAGWPVAKEDADPAYTPLNAYMYTPRIGAIEDAIKKAYLAKGNQKFRKQAVAGALPYDFRNVYNQYMGPMIADLYESRDNYNTEVKFE